MFGRRTRDRCRLAAASIAFIVAIGHVDPGWAKAPSTASLNDLVVAWMQGNYATPLYCKIEGVAERGLRRILIESRSRKSPPQEAVIRFVDLEAEQATRCFTELGGSAPNITGELIVRHPTVKSRDTAMRDFKAELRRKRGYDLEIISGRLRVSPIGSDSNASESIDFRGGTMRIHLLRPGSDGVRLLEGLPSPRQVTLEFETPAGRIFSFPASLAKPPGARTSPDSR